MRSALLTAAAAAAFLSVGCANPSRSRDLGNPEISAVTLAEQVCSNCHGVTGNSVSPNFPNLAGQTEPYLHAQLTSFKSHSRSDPAGFEYMWGISFRLTDDQIKGLAAYYSHQAPARQPVEGDPARIAAGKALFEIGLPAQNVPACSGCHGSAGQGNATFPRLAGQHADYIAKQLAVFQRTDQRPQGDMMKIVAHGLTQNDIENAAAYAQALPNR